MGDLGLVIATSARMQSNSEEALQWLRARGVEERTQENLQQAAEQLAAEMEDTLGPDVARAMAWELAVQFVPASAVMTELVQQLAAGQRADQDGLKIAGRFLRAHPDLLMQLRGAARAVDNPNEQETFNTLLARALSLAPESNGA